MRRACASGMPAHMATKPVEVAGPTEHFTEDVVGSVPTKVLVPQCLEPGAHRFGQASGFSAVQARSSGDRCQVGGSTSGDGRKSRIFDRERTIGRLPLRVPSGRAQSIDDPEILAVLTLRGPLVRRDGGHVTPFDVVVGHFRDDRQRLIPRRRVVHPGLPRMDDHIGPVGAFPGPLDPREPGHEPRPQ